MKVQYLSVMLFCAVLSSFIPANSVEESITVSTDKTSYHYGDNYTISGKVSPVVPNEAVSILILSTNYQYPESLSVIPNSEGKYLHTLPLPIKDISDGNFTIIAQYAGAKNQTAFNYTGLPCYQQNIPAQVYPAPIIRGAASNPRIIDSLGNAITGPVKVGQQIQITYTLANGLNCNQPFVYIVQIQDHNGKTISLSWIAGTLLAGQSFDPAQSWTPQYNDTYTAQIFIWQSLVNPNALAPPASISFDVEPNSNLTQSSHLVPRISSNCNEGFIHIIKKEDGSPACVKPDTAQILIERGWASNSSITYNQNIVTGTAYQIVPGSIPTPPCPLLEQTPSSIINSTGFEIYNSSGFANYLLIPGHAGSITFKIEKGRYPDTFTGTPEAIFANLTLNIKNDVAFYSQRVVTVQQEITPKNITLGNGTVVKGFDACYNIPNSPGAQSCYGGPGLLPAKEKTIAIPQWEHPGITFQVRSESVTIGPSIPALAILTISSSYNATQGTYWLILPPGTCKGGDTALLTIGTQPYSGQVGRYVTP